ncbi:glycosyltransferase [Vibrio superstes]|uniref:Glycosyl transferase n=1 Tax=Vibrio superstes NBRC 103154 TaxID=1219062 RepID=A0A511QTV3_9VIBR|nr:glycosyltransferase [Vibrio superstes]GEM80808.1 glycosyl transferase [Vibrio superstes NBRC 103154]
MKKVAVICSVYKGDLIEYIKPAMKSVLNQDYKFCELFIFVDGDIDSDVLLYLNELEVKKYVTIIYNKENVGLAQGLNTLIDYIIEKGSHDYIARMDSDDLSRENRISEQVNFLETNHDIDVVGTYCKEFGSSYSLDVKKLPLVHEELRSFSVVRCPFVHPTVMFRATVFNNNIRYPINTLMTEDMALWLDLLSKGFRFANIPQVLLDYRLSESTIGRRISFGKAKSELLIRLKYMVQSKQVSFKNLILVFLRIPFHCAPEFVLKYLYKYHR